MHAAHRTGRILLEPQLAEAQLQGIEQQQPPDQCVPRAEDELDRFERLNGPDDSRQHAEYPTLGAGRHEARRGRLWVQTAVAGTALPAEHRPPPPAPKTAP